MKNLFVITLLILSFFSCASDDNDVLSKSKMEDVLYDLHLAYSMNNGKSEKDFSVDVITYEKSVFDKHGITAEQWDSSFNYYCRRTDELHSIYMDLAERLREDVISLGGNVTDMGISQLNGDTTNIWKQERNIVLFPQSPYNVKSFEVVVDTTFHKGDDLKFKFNTQFLFQDGMRDVVCCLSATLANDSVINNIKHVSSDCTTTIIIEDDGKIGYKSIRGYFMLYKSLTDIPSTTLRVVSLSNIQMIRNRKKTEEPEKNDSTDNARSSAVSNDTVKVSDENKE